MDKEEAHIKQMLLETDRIFNVKDLTIIRKKRPSIALSNYLRYFSVAAIFLLIVIGFWSLSIPQLLFETVASSVEIFSKLYTENSVN